jgi:quercetin dioxygenase-like cupin family protein
MVNEVLKNVLPDPAPAVVEVCFLRKTGMVPITPASVAVIPTSLGRQPPWNSKTKGTESIGNVAGSPHTASCDSNASLCCAMHDMRGRQIFCDKIFTIIMKFVKHKEILESKNWIEATGYKKKTIFDENDLNKQGSVLQLNIVEPNTLLTPHHHKKMTEAVYVLSGEGAIIINNKEFLMKPGDLLTIQPNETHTANNSSDKEFRYLVFKTNFSGDDKFE